MQNITELKNELRLKAKAFRKTLAPTNKHKIDQIIFNKIISLESFKNAKTVLCYYSTETEVDTLKIIKYSLNAGKKVALPRCIDNKGLMKFYYIDSLENLEIGTFGIKEPFENASVYLPEVNDFCIIPALMISNSGYRLGYGKGYYDNFLRDFCGVKCVICYKENVADTLPFYENFDVKCDICITD